MEERKQSLVRFGYRFFYVFLLCAVLYLCFAARLPLREMTRLHLFILAALSAGISGIDSLKGRNYLYGMIAVMAVAAVVVFGTKDTVEEGALASGRLFFKEMFYLTLMVLGVYLCHLLSEKFVWIKRGAALLLLAALVAAMVCKWEVPHYGVAGMLLYMAAVLVEWTEDGWKKQKQGGTAAYLLWLLPFLAGYFILMAVIPYSEKPYDWALFVNLYHRARQGIVMLTENAIHFGNEDFGISTTGFSEGRFFGNLEKKDKVVMLIDNPNRYGGSVYLTGRNYDTFDGRHWLQNVSGGQNDHDLDALTTLYAVCAYDGKYVTDYLRERTVGVQFQRFHTGYLFAPLKTCEIRLENAKKGFEQKGGHFVFAKKQGFGTSYKVTYEQLNLANPVFAELILAEYSQQEALGSVEEGTSQSEAPDSAEKGTSQQEAFDSAKKRFQQSWGDILLADLEDYQERVKRDYTGEVALSPEAEAFLREATAGADTDYERLLCLEKALGNFAYNEKPGKLPESVDSGEKFLDYFLLDSREGYCSYFASAFVLLARAQGLPARYVQGYVVPLEGRDSREVTSNMAHAWPEVWLDGIGWIPFEPTPGYSKHRQFSWESLKKQEAERREHAANAANVKREEHPNPSEEPAEEESEQELEERLRAQREEQRRERLMFLGYFLLTVVVLGALLLVADALWERRRAAKRTLEESFRLEALRILQILSVFGYRRRGTETLSELKERLADQNIPHMAEFVTVCEEVLYGKRVPDKEALAQLCRMREALFDKLWKEKGKAYYMVRIGLYLTRVR